MAEAADLPVMSFAALATARTPVIFHRLGDAAQIRPVAGAAIDSRAIKSHNSQHLGQPVRGRETRVLLSLPFADYPKPRQGDEIETLGQTWCVDALHKQDAECTDGRRHC